jgi:hypothetical protein
MNIMLVPVIALLLAMALTTYLEALRESARSSHRDKLMILCLLIVITAILVTQSVLYSHQLFDGYWTQYFKQGDPATAGWGKPWQQVRNFDEKRFLFYAVSGGLVIVIPFMMARRWPHALPWRTVASLMFLAVSMRELYYISNYQWMYLPNSKNPVPFDASALLLSNFEKRRSLAIATIAYPSLEYGVGLIPNWGFARHAKAYSRYLKPDGQPQPGVGPAEFAAVKRFYGADEHRQRIFLTQRIDHVTPNEFLDDADQLATRAAGSFRVDGYDGDVLHLTVSVEQPCWLTFVDNWDPNWISEVNGHSVPIALALGSYKAVQLPAGESEVTFAYRPLLLPQWRFSQ